MGQLGYTAEDMESCCSDAMSICEGSRSSSSTAADSSSSTSSGSGSSSSATGSDSDLIASSSSSSTSSNSTSSDHGMYFVGYGHCVYSGMQSINEGMQTHSDCMDLCMNDDGCLAMDISEPDLTAAAQMEYACTLHIGGDTTGIVA